MSNTIKLTDRDDVRQLVREKYGAAALTVLSGQGAACCGGNAGGGSECCSGGDAITGGLYDSVDASSIPEAALLASLGCGNPTALAQLNAGEVVLDLGSGGGIDVLLSAKRVGPTGFVYGLDMTDEMLALAEKNRSDAGVQNVQFMKGHIEEIPLPDNSVDVIISNCVINLSADKSAVLRDAFRVLKPGGRFAVSDVVVEGELPEAVRRDLEAYVGCIAGALEKGDYLNRLSGAGFINTSIEPTRRYKLADLEATSCCSAEVAALSTEEKAAIDGRVMGAFIRADKPAAETETDLCCGTDCCSEGMQTEAGCCDDACCGEETAADASDYRLVQVFDPVLCCSTGVCGPSVDPALVQIAGDLGLLRRLGVKVERFNLGQQANEFVSRPAILGELQKNPNALPIVMIDGEIVSVGAYPSKELLANHLGISDIDRSAGIPLTARQDTK